MTRSKEITNSEDVIDSRDVIERIEYLESERSALVDVYETAKADREAYTGDTDTDECLDLEDTVRGTASELEEWDQSDKANELKALQALADEASGSPDWTYGEALIRDSYFKRYAQELADDIGAVPDNLSWPCMCIDWEQAARELQMDYMSVDFDGITYWIRA